MVNDVEVAAPAREADAPRRAPARGAPAGAQVARAPAARVDDPLSRKLARAIAQRVTVTAGAGLESERAAHAPVRLLQRFALTVTTRRRAGARVIDRVQIGGRPPGLFGKADKSHLTAWETYCDGLRYEIMGQTPDVALQRIEALYQFALTLPGVVRAANLAQATPPLGGPSKPQLRYTQATAAALAAHNAVAPMILNPGNYARSQKLEAIQTFAAAYLRLRNTLPLAALELERPEGGAPLASVRAHESAAQVVDAGELRDELWGLLDRRAVARLAVAALQARVAPGIDAANAGAAERRGRIVDVIRTHLASMRATYPVSYRRARLGGATSVTDFLQSIAGDAQQIAKHDERRAFPAHWIAQLVADIRGGAALPALAGGPGRAANLVVGDPGKRFAVQFETTVPNAGGAARVTAVHVGGRTAGPFGSDHGSHTTAWAVIEDQLRALVIGSTLTDAHTDLLAATAAIVNDAGAAARVGAFAPHPAYYAALAVQAHTDAVALPAARPLLERAQALGRALLMLLNTRPISAVQTGGLANARDEKTGRAAARAADVAGAPMLHGLARLTLQDRLWALLDLGALNIILDEDFDEDEIPGTLADDSVEGRAAYTIKRHLRLLQGAYPDAYRRAAIASLASVMRMLTLPTVNATRDVAIDTAMDVVNCTRRQATAMHDQLRPPAPVGVGGAGKRKRQGGGAGTNKKIRWDRAEDGDYRG